MQSSKPWYKSMTLWGAAITAAGVFAPRYASVIPSLVSDATTIVGIIGSIIGRLRATEQVTFTQK